MLFFFFGEGQAQQHVKRTAFLLQDRAKINIGCFGHLQKDTSENRLVVEGFFFFLLVGHLRVCSLFFCFVTILFRFFFLPQALYIAIQRQSTNNNNTAVIIIGAR
jgi:hypothetical protein